MKPFEKIIFVSEKTIDADNLAFFSSVSDPMKNDVLASGNIIFVSQI